MRWPWLVILAAGCWTPAAAGPAAGSRGPMVIQERVPRLHLERGPVGGGCPEDRHATCRGLMVEAFAIDARPASREQYGRCVAAGACPAYGEITEGEEGTRGPGLTVEAAERYCAWRGERLPTEGEWERARLEAPGFVAPERPAIKEVLVGWYTWIGPEWTDTPPPQYNSRLVIRVLRGASFRYGIHVHRSTPDLTFRCVASRYRPPRDPTSPALAR